MSEQEKSMPVTEITRVAQPVRVVAVLLCCLAGQAAAQQPTQIAGSNSTEALNGGWPAYEFGDNAFSGIARKPNGESSLMVSSRDGRRMAC